MLQQAKVEVYEATPHLPHGRGVQPPPPNTVARERIIGPEPVVTGRRRGQYVDRLPLPLTRELLVRGSDRYGIYCAPCHGALGTGVSQVAENMTLRRPPTLVDERARSWAPGRIYAVVTEGYGLMPSYAEALPLTDRWAVVAYLRALQLRTSVSLHELPETMRAEAAAALREAP
jgi:mono/diheme cytochrome c family protein